MTFLPAPFTVGIRTWSKTGPADSRGDPTDAWAAAVDVPVYGWGPAGTAEPFDVGRDAVTWDLDLYVPSGFTVASKDRVVVLGETYEVEGRVEPYDFGPFGFMPGSRVRLKAVSG